MRFHAIISLASSLVLGLSLVLGATACGDDEAPPQQQPGAATPAAAAAAAAAGSGKQLAPQRHAENEVTCPSPQRGSQTCDPNAPKPVVIGNVNQKAEGPKLHCDEGQYCLPTTEGNLCGKCPERDRIRHVFNDRDFAPEQNRDPFQSFVVKPLDTGSGTTALQKDQTNRCPRPDQLVASNYTYQDLKLVGIVAQGTQRKVLMMDPGQYGRIIKRGDCVGKEKAWVKEIGENFICFEIQPDQSAVARPPDTICSELHPKSAAVTSIPSDVPQPMTDRNAPPVVAPPPTPNRNTRTPIVEPPAPQGPAQTPTTIKP